MENIDRAIKAAHYYSSQGTSFEQIFELAKEAGRPDFESDTLRKLNLSTAEFESLHTDCPVGGFDGIQVAHQICAQFGLDEAPEADGLGHQLAAKGILTKAEGDWVDDIF